MILDAKRLTQYISYPTWHEKSQINHISTNINTKVIYENIIPCETISQHDASCLVLNTKKQKFQPRYKFVRGEKPFNLENYINDSSQLPLSTVHSFDDSDDQVETLNKLITDCFSRLASIYCTTFRTHRTQTESDWELFRNTRNDMKYKIKRAKITFYKKALASKNSRTIWRTIYRILKLKPQRCTASSTSLNNYYSSSESNLTGFTSTGESNVIKYKWKLRHI